MNDSKILMVTGASGHLGRGVVEHLVKKYEGKMIAGSRNLSRIEAFKEQDVELRQVDFNWEVSQLERAFSGVDKLLIISTDSIVPGERLKQQMNAINGAVSAGVPHILYTSLVNADKSNITVSRDHKVCEEAIKTKAKDWTILRNNWYIENLLPSLAHAIKTETLLSSTDEGRVGFIARADCAEVAAAALMSDKHSQSTLDVTGAQSFSYDDLAVLISHVANKDIDHFDVSPQEMRKAMAEQGMPPFVIDLFVSYEEAVAKGELAIINHVVGALTGHEPKNMMDFMLEHRRELGLDLGGHHEAAGHV